MARENRLVSADDFRTTMRSGAKMSGSHMVLYIKRAESSTPARFGFVVAKSVGGAVKRNLVKRRLRAISREVLPTFNTTATVVVRALPGSAEASRESIHGEFVSLFQAVSKKAGLA